MTISSEPVPSVLKTPSLRRRCSEGVAAGLFLRSRECIPFALEVFAGLLKDANRQTPPVPFDLRNARERETLGSPLELGDLLFLKFLQSQVSRKRHSAGGDRHRSAREGLIKGLKKTFLLGNHSTKTLQISSSRMRKALERSVSGSGFPSPISLSVSRTTGSRLEAERKKLFRHICT